MKEIAKNDKEILQELGAKKAEIGSFPIQRERQGLWTRMNNLESVKPMVWLNEVCWNEMNVNDELTLRTRNPFCQALEQQLRRELYQWEHMPGDMVVEPAIYCPLVVHDSGFGITEDVDIVRTDDTNSVVSRHFNIQIANEEDIDKIKMPVITYDREQTEENYQVMQEIFDGVIPVKKRGQPGTWFAPWDQLVRWTGVQEVLMDLVMRPEYVHKIMERLVEAYLCRLDQYEKLGLFARNDNNTRIGSGAYGYTDELPQPDFNPEDVRPLDLWGCGTAQIFSTVSPQMHWDFGLQYEIRWMERFGLNYYGCCEPLHNKLEVLKKVPRLRKISMSPWADIPYAREHGVEDYVLSIKPSPAILAEDDWHPELARAELEERLTEAKGCCVEIIMKDISTVRYKPQRLWEWAGIASEVSEEFA